MFNFRIVNLSNGDQVIRHDLKTPYNTLTPLQFLEYTEMDVQITIAEIQKKNDLRKQREEERQRKIASNPVYRLACFCGLA